MSKTFTVGVLVMLGVLLYVTSYALRQQTEPPAPPAPEVAKATADRQADVDKQNMRNALHSQQTPADQHAGNSEQLLPVHIKQLDKPLSQPIKDRNTMQIKSDWFRGTQDGEKGVDKEIAYRQTLPAPGAGPKPVVGGSTGPDPNKIQKMLAHP